MTVFQITASKIISVFLLAAYQGEYEKASHYFGKAYTMARSLGDPETVEEARTQFGISSAHKALTSFVSVVENPSRKIMAQLMNWKDVRNDAFVVALASSEEGKLVKKFSSTLIQYV